MELTFYPFDFEYKLHDEKVYFILYSKQENGQKIAVVYDHFPFFYADAQNLSDSDIKKLKQITTKDNSKTAKILTIEKVKREFLGYDKPFLQITANYPKAVPLLAKELAEFGIETYEKDILYTHRALRDLNILPMTECTAQGKENKELQQALNLNLTVFYATKITQKSQVTTKWKILAVDIETYSLKKEINPHKNPILMVALYGVDEKNQPFEKIITWKDVQANSPNTLVVEDEKALIETLKQEIQNFNPEIITGYFSDGFDFPYIKARADKLKIPFNLNADGSSIITGQKADFRNGEAKIKGILHIDILKFIKHIFGMNLKTDSYSLDAVAHELLGHKKHEVNLNELAPAWDNEDLEKLRKFCEYNLHDSRLTYNLTNLLLSEIIEFSKTVGLPVFDVIRMRFSRLVESYILKRAIEFNVVAPNKPSGQEMDQRFEESIQGGFVFEPTPGLYTDIVVFDFRSLYPTIIVSHNIGPEGLCRKNCKNKIAVPEKEEYWFCQDEKYFLPRILEDIINKRTEVKQQIKQEQDEKQKRYLEAKSYALKILANSFYGYLGFFGARWYSLQSAGSTTAFARHYIKTTIEKAEQTGFKVVYGDTDSCFFLLDGKTINDALEFMKHINQELPGQMELEFEGHFKTGIFVATKGTDKGAKKKYALMSEKGDLKITGFETVRRNWSLLAKEVQHNVLKLILEEQTDEAVNYVKQIVKDLKSGKIANNRLIIKTQITRKLSEYNAIGPHVYVAKQLEKRGEKILPGTVVEYIITKGKGLVRERAAIPKDLIEGSYDADYYLNNQIIPALSSIFAVLGYKEDELFEETTQKGLGSFF